MKLRDIAWNWAGLIVNGAVSMLLLPAMIHAFGARDFGMWALLASVISYYGLLDLGLTNSLQRFIARDFTDADGRREVLFAALLITVAVAVVVCGLSVVLALVLPKQFALGTADVIRFRNCLLLLGGSIAATFPGRAIDAVLRGLSRFDLTNTIDIVQTVARGTAVLVGIRLGYGIQFAAAVTLGVSVVGTAMMAIALSCSEQPLAAGRLRFKPARMLELCNFSGFVFLRRLGDFMRVQLDTVVIARCLTLTLVAPCAVANTLMYYFMLVMSGVLGPITTAISKHDGAQQFEASRRLFLRGTRLLTLLALFAGVLLIADGRLLLRLWLGPSVATAYPLACVLMIAYACDLAQGASVSVLMSRNRHQMLGWWTVAEGVANLILSVHWARRYGIIGVALGTALPMLFVKVVLQPWYVLRTIGCSAREYARAALLKPMVAGVVSLALCVMLRANESWSSLGMVLFGQTIVFCCVAYCLALADEDRQEFRMRAQALFMRRQLARAA